MKDICKIRDIYRLINEFEEQFQMKFGVGINEGMVLCSIFRNERCFSGEIAKLLGIKASNSSKIIASVEKKELIKRIVGEDDRRQMYFILTEAGRKKIELIKSQSEPVLQILDTIKSFVEK